MTKTFGGFGAIEYVPVVLIICGIAEARLRPENSEVERLWADNSKARHLFGWQPSYGGREGFKRGLVKTADWFSQPANLRTYKAVTYNL